MNTVLKKAALAAAISSAPFAASATDLIGGGASLPAVAYVGDAFTGTNPESRLSSSFLNLAGDAGPGYEVAGLSPGSIFAEFEISNSHHASYCQTGSGTGKRVLLGVSGYAANGECRDYSASPVGFSSDVIDAWIPQPNIPDFSGSDAPLTQDDINTFIGTNGHQSDRTNLVQVPALGALIGLPVNLSGITSNQLDLSTQQVCDIFAGNTTTWNQVSPSFPNTPITVVYRQDDSGTVFAFTQYLAATCNVVLGNKEFDTNELFSWAVEDNTNLNRDNGLVEGVYADSIAASGNGGIITSVAGRAGSIGFANFSNVASANQDYALIDSLDPATAPSVDYQLADLLGNQVLGNNNPSTGLPQPQPMTGLPANPNECLQVIDPAAQLDGVYPIAAVTNLLTYTNDNRDPAATRALFKQVLNTPTADLPVGYAQLGATIRAELTSSIDNCIN